MIDNKDIPQRKKPGPKPGVKRGRTGSDLPPAMQGTQQNLVAGSREEVAHSSGRPRRISMSNMKKLEIPDGLIEDGYYYRWFQDKEGRISQAIAAYYEHVIDEQGNNFTRQSGPYSMYLMRLKQEYRDEDNRLKKQRVAATLEAESKIGYNEYAPDSETGRAEGGRSAIQHHTSDSPYS
jgi:hypothetical protein